MSKELTELSIESLHRKMTEKELSPVELTEAYIKRVDETNKELNTYLAVYEEEAMKKARTAEQAFMNRKVSGIFQGIPLALKDNIFYKDHVTTMASKIHRDFVPSYDATVIEKLTDAGAIILGKLNMHEYALSITNTSPHFGAVKNPWNLKKIAGGSSGGSAAAISVGSTPVSVGTDTAGSIRIPAAACGIVGFKPTRGVVSSHGVYPLSWTQDHVGPMTKTVQDAAQLFAVLAGQDEKDPVSIASSFNDITAMTGDVAGMTIGIEEGYFFKDIDSPIEKATRAVIQGLVEQGAKVKEVKIPALKDMDWAGFTFSVSEASAVHYRSIAENPEDFGEDIREFLVSGAFPSTKIYHEAVQVRQQLIKEFSEVFQDVDVLISPTLPVFPNHIGESQASLNGEVVDLLPHFIRLTGPANITGLPALSVPSGVHEGLPMGVQVIGDILNDKAVLNTGLAIEKMNVMKGHKPLL